ncbi:hypothetical protein CBL_10083 [Carabus blaptoides fortunei]
MKFLIVLCVQLLIVHVAWSAVPVPKDSRNPDYSGKCYYNGTEPQLILASGETQTIEDCTLASCDRDFRRQHAWCGSASVSISRILSCLWLIVPIKVMSNLFL